MGMEDGSSRSSSRWMKPDFALGEVGLLPNRRVDDCEC